MLAVSFKGDFPSWRQWARDLFSQGYRPEELDWCPEGEKGGLLGLAPAQAEPVHRAPSRALSVPRRYLELAERVAHHRDPRKWDLLYRLLWRLNHENQSLLDLSIDDEVARFHSMDHSVRRDAHKMEAFVRFRELRTPEGESHYVAWHRPDHLILPLVSGFFRDRFRSMKWTILTPDAGLHWNGEALVWGPGCPQDQAPLADAMEDLWLCYYASIFNPARLKLRAMRAEMPVRYWKALPEAQLIDELVLESQGRVQNMIQSAPRTARPFVPETLNEENLKSSLSACRACQLCEKATQVVTGEGPMTARVMLIGEQPGDQEDRAGRPFIGPAGQVLDRALQLAGWDRSELYLTNSVKHFKFKEEGPRRIHEKPSPQDVAACKPWLEAEVNLIKPELVICLGLTAALAVHGRMLRMKDIRGKIAASGAAARTLVTYHPSHILRISDPIAQEAAFQELVADLELAKRTLQSASNGHMASAIT